MPDQLCDELIFEIFTRLPSKSLLRFRSLSKSWYSCISSPRFIRTHTLRSPQKLLIRHKANYRENDYGVQEFYTFHSEDQLPLSPTRGYFDTTPVEIPYNEYSKIVGSYNGILCLFDYQENRITLQNLSIRQKLTLTCPRRCFSGDEIAFGFDPITDDYKIVIIPNTTYEPNPESSFVYTMKTRAWSVISSTIPIFRELLSRACFVNGALHWVVERHYNKSDHADRFYILTFDLSTHVFDTIVLPLPSSKTSQLTTVRGSLAVISTTHDDGSIWVRRGASWSVVYKLERNHVFEGGLLRVLQFTTNGDLWLLYEGFHVYNPKTGVISRLADFNLDFFIGGTEMCVETLQLLDARIATN